MYDSYEWGDLIYDESGSGMEKRRGPRKMQGTGLAVLGMFLVIFGAFILIFDFLTLSPMVWGVVLGATMGGGLVLMIAGLALAATKVSRISILENGIVRKKFFHFNDLPVVKVVFEDREVWMKKGEVAFSGKPKAKLVLDCGEKLDFEEFREILEKKGYKEFSPSQ